MSSPADWITLAVWTCSNDWGWARQQHSKSVGTSVPPTKGQLKPGSSLLRPCTALRDLTSAQPWLRHGSGPLPPAGYYNPKFMPPPRLRCLLTTTPSVGVFVTHLRCISWIRLLSLLPVDMSPPRAKCLPPVEVLAKWDEAKLLQRPPWPLTTPSPVKLKPAATSRLPLPSHSTWHGTRSNQVRRQGQWTATFGVKGPG